MNSIKHTAGFDIAQPVEDLFPLFSPEGEKLWVPGWDYENIMGTADLAEDYVFLTGSHDHLSGQAIWLVKKYDPASWFIQFYRIEPEDKVGVVTVQCFSRGAAQTHVQVTYKYIALSDKGRHFLENFSEDVYTDFITEWQELLLAYFKSAT
jgi:hypothetical protein